MRRSPTLIVLAIAALPRLAAAATVSLPASTSVQGPGASAQIAVSIDDATGLEGADLRFTFNSTIITGANEVTLGPVATDCTTISNWVPAGMLRVALACQYPLSGGGVLFSIPVVGAGTGSTTVTVDGCALNEGALACTPTGGTVVVVPPTASPTVTPTRTPTASATRTATATQTATRTATATATVPPEREPRARDLITSYYTDILGRPPEAGAVDAWYNGYFVVAVNAAIDVRFVPQEMGRLFFSSAEYANRNRSNAEFIRDCYQAFLRRQPSQTELDTWLADPSWNRPQVVAMFAQSAEFSTYIAGQFPGLSGLAARNLVTALYIGLLDRLVDEAGLTYFAGRFDAAYANAGIEGVRSEARNLGSTALASAEYQSKNPTNATHVERLYRGYLGRFPATSELNYWRGELDAGRQTITSLINAFAASAEFTALLRAKYGLP